MADTETDTDTEGQTEVVIDGETFHVDVMHQDGLKNLLSGLGGDFDKARKSLPDVEYLRLDQTHEEALYESNWLAGKIIDKPPAECTRKGWTVRVSEAADDDEGEEGDEGDANTSPFDDPMEAIGLRQAMEKADCWARLKGGGGVILGVYDGAEDMSKPVNRDNIQNVYFTLDADADELRPKTWYTDPKNKDGKWGDVKTYEYTPHNPRMAEQLGAGTEIHADRIIPFYGDKLPKSKCMQNDGWGHQSVLQRVWETIRRHNTNAEVLENTLHEANQLILLIDELTQMASTKEKRNVLAERIKMLSMFGSALKAILVDRSREDVRERTADVSPHTNAWPQLAHEVAAAADMPMSLLWGQAPPGLSSDDKGGRTNWYDFIESRQSNKYAKGIRKVAEYIALSKQGPTGGRLPDEMEVVFHPLETPTEAEQADIELKHAQRDTLYMDRNVLDPEEVRQSRFSGAGYSNDIVLIEREDIPPSEEEPEGMSAIEAAGQAAEAAVGAQETDEPAEGGEDDDA